MGTTTKGKQFRIQMRLERTETKGGDRGSGRVRGWVGTDEVSGDRVRGVDREWRGEAGQEAEEGDEPEFRR